jgi:hypothetical protein
VQSVPAADFRLNHLQRVSVLASLTGVVWRVVQEHRSAHHSKVCTMQRGAWIGLGQLRVTHMSQSSAPSICTREGLVICKKGTGIARLRTSQI